MIRYVSAALIVLTSALCRAEPAPIKLGMVYALTGPAASWAAYGRQAAELAAQELNSSGHERPVQLIFEDSKSTSAGAVAAYQKLIAQDGVDAVIGDVWDFLTNPLIPLADRNHKILISPTVVAEAIERRSQCFFTMGSKVPLLRAAIEKFFAANPELRTAAIICWDNPWGHAYMRVWEEVAAAKGVNIVDKRCVYGFDYDYRTDAAAIAAKKPDAVIMGYQEERIVRRMNELHFAPKILSTNNLMAVKLQGLLSDEELEGAYFTDWEPSSVFVDAFSRRYGRVPMFEAHNHYQAVQVLSEVLRKDPASPLGKLSGLKLNGIAGPIDFTRGFAVNDSIGTLKKFQNGTAVTVQ